MNSPSHLQSTETGHHNSHVISKDFKVLGLAEIVLFLSLQASHNMYSSFERNGGDSTTQMS